MCVCVLTLILCSLLHYSLWFFLFLFFLSFFISLIIISYSANVYFSISKITCFLVVNQQNKPLKSQYIFLGWLINIILFYMEKRLEAKIIARHVKYFSIQIEIRVNSSFPIKHRKNRILANCISQYISILPTKNGAFLITDLYFMCKLNECNEH